MLTSLIYCFFNSRSQDSNFRKMTFKSEMRT